MAGSGNAALSRTTHNVRAGARALVFGAGAVLVAGCWPARFVERPAIVGAVVSMADGQPIAGAAVRLVAPVASAEPGFEVVTGRDGTFQFEPIHRWGLYTPLGEGWPVAGRVEVDALGFTPARVEVSWPQTGPRAHNVGVIELTRPSP